MKFRILFVVFLSFTFVQLQGQTELKRAKIYEQKGDLDQAGNLLLQWLVDHPSDTQVYRDLVNLYRRQENYDSMAKIIRHRLKEYPNDMQAQMELGEAFYLQGKADSARQAWETYRMRYANNKSAIRILIFTYSRLNLEDDLIRTVDQSRQSFSDPGFMAQDMANYYQVRRDFSHATDEYLRLLKNNQNRESYVRGRLLVMSDDVDDLNIIESKLVNTADTSDALKRILAAFYFKTGQLDKAFEVHRNLGWKTNEDLDRWMAFANSLRMDKHIPEAITAYQDILKHIDSKDRRRTGRSLLGLAQTFEDQIIPAEETTQLSAFLPGNLFFTTPYYYNTDQAPASLQSALTLYDSILVSMSQSKFTSAAHFRLGEIQFRITRDFDRAFANYETALRSDKAPAQRMAIESRLGQIYLAQGNPDGAEAYFDRYTRQGEPFVSEGLLTLFLRGDLDRLSTELDSTLMGYTGEELTFNDLVELQDLVSTYYSNGSDDDRNAMLNWTRAENLLWQDKINEAAETLSWIREQWPDSKLNSLVLWRETELRRYLHQTDQALALAQMMTSGDKGDIGWILIGEIQENDLKDPQKALEAYYHVLNDFPQSMLYEPVRLHIRQLSPDKES